MPSGFFKRNFDLPSFDKPFDDLLRSRRRAGAEDSLRFKLAERITNYHPPDGNGLFPNVIPDAFPAHNLDAPISLAIPILDSQSFPFRLRVGDDRLQGGQPRANGSLRVRPNCPVRRGFAFR